MSQTYEFLDKISFPSDIKYLNSEQLLKLCGEIREYMIECCSTNPGHLASSLGSVELIVALHYIYNTPQDKIIYDVGHQAYAHKILTGRKDLFRLNRKKNGISGFPNIAESEYDAFGTGHSSTSISAALGMATAFMLSGSKNKTIALIGDGAMTGGLAYEGLNNAGSSNADLLVILNDNQQSIDVNIGAFHNYLLKITTAPFYNNIKKKIWDNIGEGRFRKFLQKLTKDTKSNFVRNSGGALFEALGFRYFGPIDGNDIEQVVATLNRLKDINGPRILHVLTTKGKGYQYAEDDPTTWHAPGQFDLHTGRRLVGGGQEVYRYQDVFGEILRDLARKDDKILGITPAMSLGCGMNVFAEEFPERFFDVGIAEEHAVTFAAGLAASKMKVFCNIYSSFSQRAYDQIIHDLALQNLPVTLCFDRGGLVGEDGATHQGCFDLSSYRSIPNIIISSPKDELELKNLMYTSVYDNKDKVFIIRYPRGKGEGVDWKKSEYKSLPIGKGEKIIEGETTAILVLGNHLNRVLEAIDILNKEKFDKVFEKNKLSTSTFSDKTAYKTKINPYVYNMRYLKPLDYSILEEVAQNCQNILTIEEGSLIGGLYSAVCEYMASKNHKLNIKGIGIPDVFITQDTQENQRAFCGLDASGIAAALRSFVSFL